MMTNVAKQIQTSFKSMRAARLMSSLALALALTGLMNDREITRERALELARMVMRDNALRLYHTPSPVGTPASSAR